MSAVAAYRLPPCPIILPQWLTRGFEDVAMSEDSPILLPAPAPGGEPFEAFYQRAVVGDDDRSSLARAARYFGLDLMLHATLRPEAFTPSRFKELHDGLAVLPLGTNPDRFLRLADHLWFSANADNLPLDIRMIPHQGARLDPLPAVQPDAVAEERVAIWRRAARRRDGLLVALCEALRQGVYICEGFLAADARRQKVSIPADWWADRTFRISPLKGETVPDGVVPHYRGMKIMLGVAERPQESAPSPSLKEVAAPRLKEWWLKTYIPASREAGLLPNRDEDLAAARAAFPNNKPPSRDRIRKLRELPETPKANVGRPTKKPTI